MTENTVGWSEGGSGFFSGAGQAPSPKIYAHEERRGHAHLNTLTGNQVFNIATIAFKSF